jgi:hypothetical protein
MKETRRLSRTWFSLYTYFDVNVFVLHARRRKIQPGGRNHSLNFFVHAVFICFHSQVYELGHVGRRLAVFSMCMFVILFCTAFGKVMVISWCCVRLDCYQLCRVVMPCVMVGNNQRFGENGYTAFGVFTFCPPPPRNVGDDLRTDMVSYPRDPTWFPNLESRHGVSLGRWRSFNLESRHGVNIESRHCVTT